MRILLLLLVAVWQSALFAQDVSRPESEAARSLEGGKSPRSGFTVMQVHLAVGGKDSRGTVQLDGVSVCSATTCYEAGTRSSVPIASSTSGKSTLITTFGVPSTATITSVRFRSSHASAMSGTLALPEPLVLNSEVAGGQVLVELKKNPGDPGTSAFQPMAAASHYLSRGEGVTIYYLPDIETHVEIGLGVSLTIPAGARKTPQIFTATAHNTGNDYPLVDIYPSVKLDKPARLHMTRLVQPEVIGGAARPVPAPAQGVTAAMPAPAKDEFELPTTGFIQNGPGGPIITRQP